MKIKSLLGSIVLLSLLAACGEYKKSDSGLQYVIDVDSQNTTKVIPGSLIYMDLAYENEKDTFSSKKRFMGPMPFEIPDSIKFKGSLEEGLLMLTVGDSARFKVSTDSLYKYIFAGTPKPKEIPDGSFTTFRVKVRSLISPDSVAVLRAQYMQEMNKKMLREQMQYNEDTLAISKYLKSKRMKYTTNDRGVYVVKKKTTDNVFLNPGDSVNVVYKGMFMDGKVFDSNDKNSLFPVVVGVSSVIEGWHIGLMMFRRGESGTVYIPSKLGYGEQGAGGAIPPNCVLKFDIELIEK